MKRVSDKRAAQLADYNLLVAHLKGLSHAKSELSGKVGALVPHHIDGRRGKRLLNPFNIILLSEEEHTGDDGIQAHNTWEQKQKLAALVKEIRLRQGFTQEGTGAIKELQEGEHG